MSFAYSFLPLSQFFCYILLSSTDWPHGYFFPDHTLEEGDRYPPDTLPRLGLQCLIPVSHSSANHLGACHFTSENEDAKTKAKTWGKK